MERPPGPSAGELVLVVGGFVGVALALPWRDASDSTLEATRSFGLITGCALALSLWWWRRMR